MPGAWSFGFARSKPARRRGLARWLVALALALPALAAAGCQGELPVTGADPATFEGQTRPDVLTHVNAARATARHCGETSFAAAPPVAWNDRLARAALRHADDLARQGRLSHEGSDGTAPADRVRAAGYTFRAVGENLASGIRAEAAVVRAWLESPPHCANLMSPAFTQVGGAATDAYWVLVLAAPSLFGKRDAPVRRR